MITASVFGPLDYMTPTDGGTIVAKVLLPEASVAGHTPTLRSIELWRRLRLRDGTLVEPDVILVLDRTGQMALRICLEVKWGAAAGERQIERQWAAMEHDRAQRDESNEELLWVYMDVAQTKAHAVVMNSAAGKAQKTRIMADSWHHVAIRARALARSPNHSPHVRAWARDVHAVLEIKYPPFVGFAGALSIPRIGGDLAWTITAPQ